MQPLTLPLTHSSFGNAPVVIKLGGRSLESPGADAELAASLMRLAADGVPAVLVHGGGREVSDWCRRLGAEPRFDGGLRVTDAPSLEIAAAVLGGLANARLVARLAAGGVDAVGLGAGDGGLIDAAPHPESARLGHVGIARGVRSRVLELLLGAGHTPVVSSIGAHAGHLLNLNADEVAGAIAAAVHARALILLTDVDGVSIDGRLVARLTRGELPALIGHAEVRDGMIPKLHAASSALAGGTSRVLIAAWHGAGTLPGLLAGTQLATVVWPDATTHGKEFAHA
jgi:acetylglutamate kinase